MALTNLATETDILKGTIPKNKCDSELGLGLGLESDFVIGIAHFGILNQNHTLYCAASIP